MTRRGGFTLIELMTVMIVIGILAGLAVLRYADLRNHAIVASIVSDLENVRLGAYNYWADRDSFPPDAGAGQMPAGLDRYMGSSFQFAKPKYTLDWENFQGGSGGTGGMQVGIVVTSSDSKLMNLLASRAAGGLPYFVAGSSVAFIVVGPNGAM